MEVLGEQTMDTLRNNFKKLREASNLNQHDLANYLSIDQSLISKFEKGERSLSVSILEKACELFGCYYYDLNNEDLSPKLKAYFRKDGEINEDLSQIAKIHRLALNLLEMEEISHINE